MEQYKAKISLRQILFIYLTINTSPAIRLIPSYVSVHAKQAGWVSPIVSILPLAFLVFILHKLFKTYKEQSLMEIFYDVFGKFAGKVIVSLYLPFVLFLAGLYVRYFVERFLGSIYPNVTMGVFVVVTLAVVAYSIRSGITVLARMNELIMPILGILFFTLTFLLLPNIRLDYILPVSTRDALPIVRGSVAPTVIDIYLFLLFFLGDKITNKDKMGKLGLQAVLVLVVLNTLLVLTTLGTLGHLIIKRLPIPYLVAVRQISVLNIIEKIESLSVGIWVFSDLILIGVIIQIGLSVCKSLFNLKSTTNIVNIYTILVGLLSYGIALTGTELEYFSKNILAYVSGFYCFLMPVILFIIGKIRRKV